MYFYICGARGCVAVHGGVHTWVSLHGFASVMSQSSKGLLVSVPILSLGSTGGCDELWAADGAGLQVGHQGLAVSPAAGPFGQL